MAGRSAKIIQISQREIVNHETGQVVRQEHERVMQLPQEPEYIKLYLQDLADILDVPAGPQGLLMALVRKLDYEGMITLSPAARDRIAALLKIKTHTLANYLTMLCEKGILKRTGRGEYEMNPSLMAKGSWPEILKRRATFQMIVTYAADGTRTITGDVIGEKAQPDLPFQQQCG